MMIRAMLRDKGAIVMLNNVDQHGQQMVTRDWGMTIIYHVATMVSHGEPH